MRFTLETRSRLEIHMEVLLLAARDLRMTGCWPKSDPIFFVDQLPGAHRLDLNWRIVLPYGCDDELAKVLQDAAARRASLSGLKVRMLDAVVSGAGDFQREYTIWIDLQ